MPISKLESLPFPPPPTPPFSASGQGLVASVNQLIDTSVASLKSLTAAPQTDTVYSVIGFYVGSTIGGGKFVWSAATSKALHNGGTIISPESIAAWDGTQANLATLLNWAGAGAGCWIRLLGDSLSFDMFGAVADGATNDTEAVNKAASVSNSMQYRITGAGSYYAVSGNITLPSWAYLQNVKFKQLTPNSTTRRTLFQTGGTFCRLENVTVDRNGDGSGGALSDAAGVWINACTKAELVNVEVFGNDFGNGIAVISCDNAEIDSPYVHDITGGTAFSPAITDDTIQGVWIQGGTGVRLINPRVKNLLNRWTGQPAFNRFSRGVAFGGTKRFTISNPMVDIVDQGIDLTGGDNPEFFEVSGGVLSNCYTWGAKCANSVQNGVFTGVIAYRCGNAGFVASAPSIVLPDATQNITYTGCRSIQTGFGGVWTALSNVAGFRVADTVTYPDYPRSIKYVGCSADGTGGVMEYGFYNDAALGTTDGEQWVEAMHCDVQGATVANYLGLQTGYASRQRNTTQSIPNSVFTDLLYDSTTDYMNASSGVTAAELGATRSGIYTINAGVVFEGSSTGTRYIRIMLNGGEVLGSLVRLPAVTANEFGMSTSVTIPINAGGLPIKVQVAQDSGGALNVISGAMRLSLVSAGYGG